MRNEQVQQASAQFETFNGRLGPQAMFDCPLNSLYSHSRKKKNQDWNASLCVADSLMKSVSL